MLGRCSGWEDGAGRRRAGFRFVSAPTQRFRNGPQPHRSLANSRTRYTNASCTYLSACRVTKIGFLRSARLQQLRKKGGSWHSISVPRPLPHGGRKPSDVVSLAFPVARSAGPGGTQQRAGGLPLPSRATTAVRCSFASDAGWCSPVRVAVSPVETRLARVACDRRRP